MTYAMKRAQPLPILADDRLEWVEEGHLTWSMTARRYTTPEGVDMWVVPKLGVYVGADGLLTKVREVIESHGEDAKCVRLGVDHTRIRSYH